jgi:hypothetical protein
VAVPSYYLGTILVILNLRLESWLASSRGIDLAEMRRLLPVWIIPLLTLSVVAWVGLLLKVTKSKRRRNVAGGGHP